MMDETEWLVCTDPQKMLEFLANRLSERKLRLFAVASCRRIEHLLPHKALHSALEVSEQYADGLASRALLEEALGAALALAGTSSGAIVAACMPTDPLCPECGASMKLRQGRRGLFHGCSTYPRCRGVLPSLHSVADTAARAGAEKADYHHPTGWELAHQSELSHQSYLIRDIVGNPFRSVSIDPAWLAWNDGVVVRMARATYDKRAFDRLPLLADALEEAGCDKVYVLDHCRQQGAVHIRGCWLVDLLTGRS